MTGALASRGSGLGEGEGGAVALGVGDSVAVVVLGVTSRMGSSGSTLSASPMVAASAAVTGLLARALYRSPFCRHASELAWMEAARSSGGRAAPALAPAPAPAPAPALALALPPAATAAAVSAAVLKSATTL